MKTSHPYDDRATSNSTASLDRGDPSSALTVGVQEPPVVPRLEARIGEPHGVRCPPYRFGGRHVPAPQLRGDQPEEPLSEARPVRNVRPSLVGSALEAAHSPRQFLDLDAPAVLG